MLDNGKINGRQLMVLVFLYSIGTTVLIIPSGLAAVAKQDAWIGALAGVLMGAGIVWLFAGIWRAYPGQTFVGICETALGKVMGTAVSIVYIFYSFIGASTVLFYVSNFFLIHFLPRTPVTFTTALFVLIVVMGSRMGLETIARTSELMLPWFIILLVVLVSTLTPQLNSQLLLPVFESGLKSSVWAGVSFARTAYMPIVFMFPIFVKVQEGPTGKVRIGLFAAAMAGGLCVVLVTLLCIMILGPNITMRSMFPSYALVKKISIGNFVQRIEVILAGLWFITTYMKTTFYYYSMVTSLSEVLKLKNYRTVTLPCGMILVVFSQIVYPDVIYMQNWDSIVFPPYMITMAILVPIALWIIGLLRGTKEMPAARK